MDFKNLVDKRFSCRSYRNDPVPREHVESMLECARAAPSACNRQPWRFVIVTARQKRYRMIKAGLLPGISMQWALDAPLIVVLGLREQLVTHRLAPLVSGVRYSLLDAGIAGEHLVLRATELGLGTCWIGWIKPRAISELVGWKKGVVPVALITVGWPESDMERGPAGRLPLSEMVSWIDDGER